MAYLVATSKSAWTSTPYKSAMGEGIDDISVRDIRKLILFLREALNVLLEGHVRPLPAVMQVPRVTGSSVPTQEMFDEG
jgi:hypothetical protein